MIDTHRDIHCRCIKMNAVLKTCRCILFKGMILMLDGKAVTPLYVQLMNQIEERIRKGVYAPGERLQSESEMAKAHGVSIITVRNAISMLVDKGLVDKKQGKGTFVAKPKFTKDIKKLQSFPEMCKHMGMRSGGRMLENKLIPADEKTRKLLGIPRGSQVVYISRVRYADDEPVAIENNYFPLKYSFLLGEVFDNNSLFEFMKEKSKIFVAVSEKWIELCRATSREAELLGLSSGEPLLYIKSVAYTRDREPIYVGTQIFNGDRCSFYVCESTDL